MDVTAAADLRTPLYAVHQRHGARMVPFAGWQMPVQYSGITEEHRAVRSAAGLFDVSHMGELVIEGAGALDAVQRLVTNDAGRLEVGEGLYSPMCTDSGGILDDLTVFRIDRDRYLLIVNAATTDKDRDWVEQHRGRAVVRDLSREMALLALQGPAATAILARVTRAPLDAMRLFDALPQVQVAGVPAYLSRTGYTGEDGFEIGPAWDDAVTVWDALLEAAGDDPPLVPVGLAARDTLRLEAGLMLYGADIDETTTPLEAPLGWTVKWAKETFTGKDALLRQKAAGVGRKLVGLTVRERAIARHGYDLFRDEERVGQVTSGTHSPTLGTAIALGYVPPAAASAGTALAVDVRGRRVPVEVTRLPFYRRAN